MLTSITHIVRDDTTMKRYAVFATKTEAAQKEGDYTIWHYLNSTNSAPEAIHWRQGAIEHDDYDQVVIVSPLELEIKAGFGDK